MSKRNKWKMSQAMEQLRRIRRRERRKRRTDAKHVESPQPEAAKVVVGIDFGTTFSGFAYASMAETDKVFTFYEWPSHAAAGERSYCKTQTSLWYLPPRLNGPYELQNWGWPALVNYKKALQAKNSGKGYVASPETDELFVGRFLADFKLHLGDCGSKSGPQSTGTEKLPDGLPVERLISDYLRKLSALIMAELEKKFGSNILKKDVKWCLTVPAMWTERSKQIMKYCAQKAGLVQGPRCRDEDASPHDIVIVLEPEAASFYCQQKFKDKIRKGSRFLVVDAGGGTVDLVVHEKVDNSGLTVKEAARNSGDFCGGIFVDKAFMDYLARKIDCFQKFSDQYPNTVLTIKGNWENLKLTFDGEDCDQVLQLPGKLTDAWRANQKRNGSWRENSEYFELLIPPEDMRKIFDGVVNKILKLIDDLLVEVPSVEAIFVVGGFSNSPYLMRRVRDTFSSSVPHILSPVEPGSAVCQGAVTYGVLGPDTMTSRKSKKTYGIEMARPFKEGDPLSSQIKGARGTRLCDNTFEVFTRIGDDVPVNHKASVIFYPVDKNGTHIPFTMYSTIDPQPAFVTDDGVKKVGSWTYNLPPEAFDTKKTPEVELTMYFGRTVIDVFAKPKNFKGKRESMYSVLFETD